MSFQRKPSLGRYNASRQEWKVAYRTARIATRRGEDPDPKLLGIWWKARLIVAGERNRIDPLTVNPSNELVCRRIVDELLAENDRGGNR